MTTAHLQIGTVVGEEFTNWRGWKTTNSPSVSLQTAENGKPLIMLSNGHIDGTVALTPVAAQVLAGLLETAAVKAREQSP